MKNSRYEIINERRENCGDYIYSYIDKEDKQTYSFSIDKEYNFIFNKGVSEKDLYLAYIDYVNKNCLDYFFRKLRLERVPKGYINLYNQLTVDNSEKVSKYIEAALQNVMEAASLMDDVNVDNTSDFYSQVSYLNQAQSALTSAKKLSRKR